MSATRTRGRRARRRLMKAGAATVVATSLAFSAGTGAASAGTVTIPAGDYGAVELPVQSFATGWPFWFADKLGLMPVLPDGIGRPAHLSSWHPRDFYNAITGISTDATIDLDTDVGGVHITDQADVMARAALVASFGSSSYATMDAYRALAKAALGAPLPAGYTPIEAAPGRDDVPFKHISAGDLTAAMYQDPALPNTLALLLALIRDPGTPNGGIAARFAPLPALFGINLVTPDVEMIVPAGFDLSDPYSVEMRRTESRVCVPVFGCSTVVYDVPAAVSNWDGGRMLIPLKFTMNWEYDLVGDFPVTINPVSLANSVMAGLLPTYIARDLDTAAVAQQIADQLGVSADVIVDALSGGDPGSAEVTAALNNYLTVRAAHLPLLEPLRLPIDLINAVLGTTLRNPIADALEPALRILVNIGYTDVVTPADIAANPALAVYGEYGRTLDLAGVSTPFLSQSPLTLDEYLRVPGDVLTALLTGIKDVVVGNHPGAPQRTPAVSPPETSAPVSETTDDLATDTSDSTDSSDGTDSADGTDSPDSTDSADGTDNADRDTKEATEPRSTTRISRDFLADKRTERTSGSTQRSDRRASASKSESSNAKDSGSTARDSRISKPEKKRAADSE